MAAQNLWIELKDDVVSSHVALRSILPEEIALEMPQITYLKCVSLQHFCTSIPKAHVSFNVTNENIFYCLM